MDNEYVRIWRRDIAFTGFQVLELILCFILYIFYSTTYQSMQFNENIAAAHYLIFRGYILSVYLLLCNVIIRYNCSPKHLINPLEVVIALWFWIIYMSMSMAVMKYIPVGSWKVTDANLDDLIRTARKLAIGTLITSKIFLLDALLRIDVLVIKRSGPGKSPTPSLIIGKRKLSAVSTPPMAISSSSTQSKYVVNEPLNIDFYWFRFPDCLVEDQVTVTSAMRLSLADSSLDTCASSALKVTGSGLKSTLSAHKDVQETLGETHGKKNLMSVYATARKKRKLSFANREGSIHYLTPFIQSPVLQQSPSSETANAAALEMEIREFVLNYPLSEQSSPPSFQVSSHSPLDSSSGAVESPSPTSPAADSMSIQISAAADSFSVQTSTAADSMSIQTSAATETISVRPSVGHGSNLYLPNVLATNQARYNFTQISPEDRARFEAQARVIVFFIIQLAAEEIQSFVH